jgi:hypothetical protein
MIASLEALNWSTRIQSEVEEIGAPLLAKVSVFPSTVMAALMVTYGNFVIQVSLAGNISKNLS